MAKNAFGDEIVGSDAAQFLAPDPILLPARRPVGPKEARDMADAVLAGFQSSATGLAARGELPTLALPENAPWYHRLGANAAGVLADLPLSIAAAVPAGAAGTAAGPAGTLIAGGAAAFAAPMGIREALMTAYSQDHARSWGDVWQIAKQGALGAIKGAVIGGATMGAGRAAAPFVAGAGTAARVGVPLAAELGALTTTAAALENHMPTAQDFMDNALLLGGMKGAVAVAGKMRALYAETGKHPAEVAGDALKDPKLRAELLEEFAPPAEGAVRGYHGSPWRITGDLHQSTDGAFGAGIYVAKTEAAARNYASGRSGITGRARDGFPLDSPDATVAAVDVRLRNPASPKDMDAVLDAVDPHRRLDGRGVQDALKTAGFDGIETMLEFVVFRPEQAKVVGQSSLRRQVPEAYINATIEQRVEAALGADPRPEMLRGAITDAIKEAPKSFDEMLTEMPQVKMEYLQTGADMQAFTRSIEAMYRGEIETATRGEVTAKQTIAEAMAKAAGLEPHQVGAGVSPSEMAARAFVFREASAAAMRALKDQALKPEVDRTTADNLQVYASLERAYMAYQNMRGAAAETGRALNILWQLKYRPDLMGEAKGLEALFEKKIRKEGHTFSDIAALAAAMKDPSQLARFADTTLKATKMEMVIEGWKAAILSGPLTHMANLMGNSIKFAVEVPETAVAASIGAVRRALQGETLEMAELKARAFAPLYGLKWGTRDALVIAQEALMGKGEHLEKGDIYRHAIPGKAGYVIRTPFRALQSMDVLFRTTAERGKAHEMAVERAIKEGFKPETREYNERVANYTMEPTLGLTAEAAGRALETIQQVGSEAVFTQRLGPMLEKLQLAFAGTPMQFVLPFVRTPANLLSWAVQHIPGGQLLSPRWMAEFKAGGASRDRALAKTIMGGALALTAYSLVEDGLLTGGGMFDPEERRTKMAAGWQPYSIKIGDTYYSYQRLEPVGKVLGLVADLMEMRAETDADRAKAGMASIALFGNAIISTTYLSGVAGLFNAVTDPKRYGERWYEQYAASLVPKIVGQTAQLTDPHFREVNGVIDSIQSQIPFLREKLLPQRDLWGDPREAKKLFGALPVAASVEAKDKVKSEAMRLQLALADIPKFMYESGPLRAKERQIEFTPEQRDVAREVSGKWAMSQLAPIVGSPDWDKLPDFAKASIYQKVTESARSLGREAALPATAPEREQMRLKIVNEINRQINESERSVK